MKKSDLIYSFLNIPEVQKIGVYAIHNKANNQYYIGSSVNVYKRLLQHNHSGTNARMIKDRFIYMPEEWEIIILKTFENNTITSDDLIKWENYYINKYNAIKNGYNTREAYNTENNDFLVCKEIKPQNNKASQQWEGVTITLPKGTKERIKAAGVGSVNGYINKLVADDLKNRGV